jgi:hypothetical protein
VTTSSISASCKTVIELDPHVWFLRMDELRDEALKLLAREEATVCAEAFAKAYRTGLRTCATGLSRASLGVIKLRGTIGRRNHRGALKEEARAKANQTNNPGSGCTRHRLPLMALQWLAGNKRPDNIQPGADDCRTSSSYGSRGW